MNFATLAQPKAIWQWRNLMAMVLVLLLTGCGGSAKLGELFNDDPQAPSAAPAQGGKIALLLPLSGPGQNQKIAVSLQQAAELAITEAGGDPASLIIKDTAGSPETARIVAQAAIDEGAGIILGPLISAEVQAVSPVASAANVNVVAFTSIRAAAAPGTYLMSFLPDEEVSNVLRYAASKGYRNVSVLYPANQYGAAIEKAANEAVVREGATLVSVQTYAREATAIEQPAATVAAAAKGEGAALLLPEGGQMLRNVGLALQANGVDPRTTKILGTGLWDDALTRSTPIALSGWYAGVSPQLVQQFEQKFMKAYGNKPPRIASLAYDAAVFAHRLTSTGDVSAAAITNPAGFQGANGLFRFRENGLIERGLSILQMGPGGPDIIAPAPAAFSSPAL